MRRAWFASLVAIVLAAGCSDATQVIVTVDADPEVRSRTRSVDFEIYGGARAVDTVPNEGLQSVPIAVLGDEAWPVRLALAPRDDDADRLFRVVATARGPGGGYVAQVRAISGYAEGKTLWLRLYIDRHCLGVDPCESPDETCAGGECVSARHEEKDLPEWNTDAGALEVCSSAADCDDGIACTEDSCVGARCMHEPDDARCVAGSGGRCDPMNDCQYATCDESTCVPGPCQTAECVGSLCERRSTCTADQMCCAGECVARRCDDGNPCTNDACGVDGCQHVLEDGATCDDGTFCNGADTCFDGDCVHEGDPCAGTGADMCSEDRGVCVGCTVDSDCAPMEVEGDCLWEGVCDEEATRNVIVTHYACMDGACIATMMDTETRDCAPRSTDGTSCDDGSFCNGSDLCAGGTCTHSGSPCSIGEVCDDIGDECRPPVVSDGGVDGGPGFETYCDDGMDNDGDGDIDCADLDCEADAVCWDAGAWDGGPGFEMYCDDGIDDDGDGDIDCADLDCEADPVCWDAGAPDGGSSIEAGGPTMDGGV